MNQSMGGVGMNKPIGNQFNEKKTVDTVCHQCLFDHQSLSELITQGYFQQVILGLDLVEMRVQMF